MPYSFNIKEFVEDFNSSPYQINIITIFDLDNKFDDTAQIPFVEVSDSSTSVKSFLIRISGNKKDLIGYFTSDAFDAFSGNVTISFGYGEITIDMFENINISAIIIPLSPLLTSLNAPLGDNDWLNSLNL